MNNHSKIFFCTFPLIFVAVLALDHATAQESQLDLSGSVKFESIVSEIHGSSFIPKSRNSNYTNLQFLTKANMDILYKLRKFVFSSNGQMILGEGNDVSNTRAGNTIGRLNELYFEYFPTISTGVFAGRRNMSFGQARVINPSDFFNENSFTRGAKGSEKIGTEFFGSSGYTIQAIWSPSTGFLNEDESEKFYLSYHTLIGESYSDFLLFALYSDRPGGGVSVATTTESGLVLYIDSATRIGETFASVQHEKSSGSYDVLPIDDSAISFETTAGLNYDFVDGLSITAEFSHLSSGFNSEEWTTYVDAFSNARSSETFGKLFEINRNWLLRQNYFYFRLSHSDLIAKIDPQLSLLLGIDDFSSNWRLGLSRDLGDSYNINLNLERDFGRNSGQFARSTERGTIRLSLVGLF